MEEINSCIKCSVHDCIYNENNLSYCTKEKIRICLCEPESLKESTMCDSYVLKKENKRKKKSN